MTKTKTSGGKLLATMVAVILGAGFFYGVLRNQKSDERSGVILSVIFEPAERVTSVEIVVAIDDIPSVSDHTRKTGWNRTVTLRRGETVTLSATQTVPAKLSCAINGEIQETRAFPGTVRCKHRRA